MKGQERQRAELAHEFVTAFAKTFIPRWDRFPMQNLDGSYIAVKRPLTFDFLENHMRGKVTLGAYALDSESRAHWICFDADDKKQWEGLQRLALELDEQLLPSYLELSRRGGHLWLFTEPITGSVARRFGRQLLKKHDLEEVELYPKQDLLRTGPGSLVRLPLGIHRKDNKCHYFVTLAGTPLAPTIREQMRLLAHPGRIPKTIIDQAIAQFPDPKPVFPSPHFQKSKQVMGDLPSERIKNRISVYDCVSQYIDLDKNGRGLCPFHDDHRVSFSVDQEHNFWHCFAGCKGQTVIDFWMQWRELNGQDGSFKATITELAERLLLH